MNSFPVFGWVMSSPAIVFTETSVQATLSTVMACPTLPTTGAVVLFEDVLDEVEDVDEEVLDEESDEFVVVEAFGLLP